MNKVNCFLVTLSLLGGSLLQDQKSSNPPRIDEWLFDSAGYARAIEMQREMNIPLVVYFCSSWVTTCSHLDNNYLSTAPVREFLNGVIKVRIDPEHGEAERRIARKYRARGLPTFVVVSEVRSVGQIVNPYAAHLSPAQFADACWTALAGNPKGVRKRPMTATSAMTMRAVADATKQTNLSQVMQVQPGSKSLTKPVSGSLGTTLNAILKDYATVVGGEGLDIKTTVRKGVIEGDGIPRSGRLELFSKVPNKSLQILRVKPGGIMRQGFDGKSGWELTQKIPSGTIEAAELWAVVAEAEYYNEANLTKLYKRMSLIGREKDGGREAYVVEATPKTGAAETLYFDVESGLLTHRTIPRQTSEGVLLTEIYFGDWRDVNGVKAPFKVTYSTANRGVIIRYTYIKHNLRLPEALFRRPRVRNQ